jgi:hypothetical protein
VDFVPDGFDPPRRLATEAFVLEPLGPEHNEADYAAWTSSMEHIHASPGFERWKWPREMTLEENLRDLDGHAADFAARRGFTYTVLDPDGGATIGCLYVYPAKDDVHDADVHSWVRADRAELDAPLRSAVREWLAADWPFRRVAYAG